MFTESRTQNISNKNDTFGDSRIPEFTGSLKGEPGAPGPDLDQTRKDTERLRSDEERERETQALESFKRVHINMAPDPRTIPRPISGRSLWQQYSDTSNLEFCWKIALYTRFENFIVRIATLDTTSSLNFMGEDVVSCLGVELEPYDGPPLVDLTGRILKPLGTCRVDWQVTQRPRTYTDKFVVIEVPYMEYDVSLGTDTIKQVGFFRRNNAVWYDPNTSETRSLANQQGPLGEERAGYQHQHHPCPSSVFSCVEAQYFETIEIL